ncbi:PAS domain-containing protein [Nocardioides ungokensis]|uniref:PAS domain-containing protein n=1 Tax=Nocardioides ungokensis TaxID=1643322 RepID=UPI001FE5AF48|nr:PAS domain-containing protein [Nocardioides ungokensis]
MSESAQTLADALADGAVIADADGRVTLVNRVAGQMLGVQPEDAVGKSLADVLALRDQDGRDWFSSNCPYQGLVTRSAIPEQPWLLPNGSEVLVVARIHRRRCRPLSTAWPSACGPAAGRARLDRERSDLVATVAHELRSPLTGVKGSSRHCSTAGTS